MSGVGCRVSGGVCVGWLVDVCVLVGGCVCVCVGWWVGVGVCWLVVVVVVVVLTCAFNKGVCPSMPTGAPNYGHVPVDMAQKNPHVQAAWTCPHAGKHRESDSRVLPALRLRSVIPQRAKAQSVPTKPYPQPTRVSLTQWSHTAMNT